MKKQKRWINFSFCSIVVFLSFFVVACKNQTSKRNSQASFFNAKLGAAYLQQNRLLLANEKLQKALVQAPDNAQAHHYYALLNQKLKQQRLADLHFKYALSLDGKNPELHNNYGTFLCEQKKYALAEKEFITAWQNPFYKTPEFAYTNAGICMLGAGNRQKARNYLDQALEIKPNFTTALLAKKKVYN